MPGTLRAYNAFMVISNLVVASMVIASVTAARALIIIREAYARPSIETETPAMFMSSVPSTVRGMISNKGKRKKETMRILFRAKPSGNPDISNMNSENKNPNKAILISFTKTKEKISKVKDTTLARGSK
jgi:hypothetical protein